ncbi:hypothetical protein GKN89_06140 [Serratia sp. YC16]|uniref:hypothetical protein n=1 Tax=Serratia sp. YC16 TaxID=2675312 RepID=UPI0012B8B881|nr:hypothetical protein [Serratia sp. YC16]MTD06315.1 hypothetical protein [Serratia sp. YC16]
MDLFKIVRKLRRIYSPSYLYTLDRSVTRTVEGDWLFKEFGTHTFVKKNWGQLVEGDFLRHVNPKDIAFIAETESKIKIASAKLSIHEEKRNCMWTLKNGADSISISGKDFLRNRELVDKTESLDATKIAFYAGVKEGREISASLQNAKKGDKPKKTILTLIK